MTRLILLDMYLIYFLPDRPGQLVTSLTDDNVKAILYHSMRNMWKMKMVQYRNNFLDGPTHSMTELSESRIVNLEQSIPPRVPPSNKKNKEGSKKKKALTQEDFKHKY